MMKKTTKTAFIFYLPLFILIFIVYGCDSELNVSITAPRSGDTFDWGETVVFKGTVSAHGETVTGGISCTWNSNRDGFLGNGLTCICQSLSVGRHIITLTAVDTDNRTSSDRIRVTVKQRTGLIIREHDFIGPDYLDTLWATVTLRDRNGEFITGKHLDDFRLTESIISRKDGSVLAESDIDAANGIIFLG